jgi:hypothetical protein
MCMVSIHTKFYTPYSDDSLVTDIKPNVKYIYMAYIYILHVMAVSFS